MHELQPVYANYLLQFPWQAYHTQTFRKTRHDSTNAVSAVWDKLSGKLKWTRGFIAVENHKLGGIHLHALLANDYDYEDWQIKATRSYMSKAFGWIHIEPIRNLGTVSLYCAKYVTKEAGDYSFCGKTWDVNFWSSNSLAMASSSPITRTV